MRHRYSRHLFAHTFICLPRPLPRPHSCFSVLLTVFLVGWYFKRKWDIRSMRRVCEGFRAVQECVRV